LLPRIGGVQARSLAGYWAKAGVLLFQFGLRKDGMALPKTTTSWPVHCVGICWQAPPAAPDAR
jgi:hypothetical protein